MKWNCPSMNNLNAFFVVGAVYLDFPGDLLGRTVTDGMIIEAPLSLPPPPRSCAELKDIKRAVELLRSAQRPLLVVGKGAAYARAEDVVNQFVQMTNIPVIYFPSIFGKCIEHTCEPFLCQPAHLAHLGFGDAYG